MNTPHPRTPAASLRPLATPFVLLLALGGFRAAPLPLDHGREHPQQGMLGSGGCSLAAVRGTRPLPGEARGAVSAAALLLAEDLRAPLPSG